MKNKKLLLLAFLVCLISTLGFALPNQGSSQNPLTRYIDLLKKGVNMDNQIKQLPVSVSEDKIGKNIKIQVGDQVFSGKLSDNKSAEALIQKLPLSLDMKDLNGNEKFYFFDEKLPTEAEPVNQIKSGDIMLYGSDCLVIFYESFDTSYSYTRLGNIENAQNLKQSLGNGQVKVSFDISD